MQFLMIIIFHMHSSLSIKTLEYSKCTAGKWARKTSPCGKQQSVLWSYHLHRKVFKWTHTHKWFTCTRHSYLPTDYTKKSKHRCIHSSSIFICHWVTLKVQHRGSEWKQLFTKDLTYRMASSSPWLRRWKTLLSGF